MAEAVETEHPGVLLYVKCHAGYAATADTLLTLGVGDLVAVVEEKAETGWCAQTPWAIPAYSCAVPPAAAAAAAPRAVTDSLRCPAHCRYSGFLLSDPDATPKWFPMAFVRQVRHSRISAHPFQLRTSRRLSSGDSDRRCCRVRFRSC